MEVIITVDINRKCRHLALNLLSFFFIRSYSQNLS